MTGAPLETVEIATGKVLSTSKAPQLLDPMVYAPSL